MAFLWPYRGSIYTFLAAAYVGVAIAFLRIGTKANTSNWAFILSGVILLGPPIWSMVEYHFIYKVSEAAMQEVSFERFKYNQELAARVWAAVSAVALAIVYKKF